MTKDQKPKRSYTVTERVLAACRLNIKKAQKAALEQRFCVTRGTSRELDARHAKLELAQKVKREDRTYKYCSCFRHGLLVADLERSLFMAGESRAEYQAHLARFEALPAVFALDAGSDQVKLARACAFASWRRLRAFRLHSEWALRMMVHHLRKVIRERQAASGEEKASLGDREKALQELVLSSAAQSGSVIPSPASFQRGEGSRSAEAMPDSSLAGSGLPAAPRNDGLNECFHSPAGQPLSLTPEQFLELGRGLRWAAESWPGVWQPITRLNNRFDQLWCMLVEQLGEPAPILNEYFLECARMRTSSLVGRFDLYPAEVLGNPLLRPRRVEELLESRPLQVKPVRDWSCASQPYEVQERLGRPVSLMGSLDYRVLREARKPHAESCPPADASRDAEQAAELPHDFEEFLALVEAAFGEGSGPVSDQGAGVRFCDSEPWARPEPRKPNTESRNRAPTLRDLAQLLWQSATLHRRRAGEEARCLAEYLADYARRLSSADPQDTARRRRVATEILKLFRQGVSQQEESVVVTRRARLALHDIAVARFGRRPEWEEQLLYLNDRFEQQRSEFFDLYFTELNPQAVAGDG